ncbi:MAG: response regulator [Alphaproteobacteria bacterium]
MDRAKLKVLTGDDHMLSRRLVEKQLEVMGFKDIRTATNGEELLLRLSQEPYDVVILDWVMPVKTGMDVLKECRAQKKYDKIAFVMLSAEAHDNMIQEALAAGANGYIVKPVTQAVFEDKMKSVLGWLEKARGG